jgi:hypothetical protein
MHALCKISSRLWRPKLRRPDRNSHAHVQPALTACLHRHRSRSLTSSFRRRSALNGLLRCICCLPVT